MPLLSGRRIEFGFLLALCFFLPLYEAPKNLAWLGYVVAWIWKRARTRDVGGPWDPWDTLFAAWIASVFVVAAFAGRHANEWRAALDVLRYGAVLWMLKRSRLTVRETLAVLGTLAASALLGLGIGTWEVWSGAHQRLELNSVGHVNHTAIYLAIVLGLCASWLFAGSHPLAAGGATVLVYAGLFATASRGALAAGILALCVLAAAWWRRSRWPALEVALLLAATTLAALLGNTGLVEKQK